MEEVWRYLVLSALKRKGMDQLCTAESCIRIPGRLRHCSKEKWLKFTMKKIQDLAEKEVLDYRGRKILLKPNQGETFRRYATHFLAGKDGSVSEATLGRAVAAQLIDRTLSDPLLVLRQEGDIVKYMRLYRDENHCALATVVVKKHAGQRRVVTSYATISTVREKNKAFRTLLANVRNARYVNHVRSGVVNGDLSRHLTSPTELGASRGDAALNSVGSMNIDHVASKVNRSADKINGKMSRVMQCLVENSRILEKWASDKAMGIKGSKVLVYDRDDGTFSVLYSQRSEYPVESLKLERSLTVVDGIGKSWPKEQNGFETIEGIAQRLGKSFSKERSAQRDTREQAHHRRR